MGSEATTRLVAALGPRERRTEAVDRLAEHLGAAAVYVFVTHPDASTKLIPAPALARTLPSSRGWRDLMARAATPGVYAASVAFPSASESAPAIAYAHDGIVVVVVGHDAPQSELAASLELLAPLLAATLRAEAETIHARGELAVAHDATKHAAALAQALDVARSHAERATRVKDEFLAMLGHELRNPLAPIVTGLQMLRLEGLQSRVIDVIDRQVQHMSRLVDDLLDVSRITRGKIELRRDKLEIATAIIRALEMARPILEQKRSELRVDVPPDGLTVYGDAARLAQVFSNLITNAAKYSDRGARIHIEAQRVDQLVRIAVTDSGIGISKDYIEQVFDQFVQVPQGIDRSAGGLGLGLAIVRSLVTLHGGRVSAQSPGEGQGSTFIVELPFAPGAPDAEAAPSSTAPTAAKRKTSVLVVDDNADAAELLADLLETYGYQARIAHSGPEALALIETFSPELALLDIGLPVMDGYQLARELRIRIPQTKLVAVTGYGQGADRERATEAGFAAHLVKPVSIANITKTLETVLRP